MTSLPSNPFKAKDEPALNAAYELCLGCEHNADSEKGAMYARCLGYFLIEPLPGQLQIANDIIRCGYNQDKMYLLAELYINHLIRLFRQNKGTTPAPSNHPSRPSFNLNSDFLSDKVESAPQDHRAAKRAALERDDSKCMVTGITDMSQVPRLTPEQARQMRFSYTNYCHIFPPSTNWNLKLDAPGDPKTAYSTNVWNLVQCFSGISVLKELGGDNIHHLSNGLTLSREIHDAFDHLMLWFEEVSTNTYRVCSTVNIDRLPTYPVTFTSSSDNLVLPDPRYLKLHAAVCRVAHKSGVAGYLDKHDYDVELMPVLAADGSSMELLTSRLQRLIHTC